MPNQPNHQDESHEDSVHARQQAHADAETADATARRINPFSLTNIILTVALAVGSWMALQIWSTLQETEKDNKAAVSSIQRTMQDMHDTLIAHGFKLDVLQSDVTVLKANCLDKAAVEKMIWEKWHPASSVGGGSMDYPHVAGTPSHP